MIPLHSDRRLIAATLRGSSTHRAQEVAAFVEKALQARHAQEERARANAQRYSQKVHAGIRKVVALWPHGYRVSVGDVLEKIARAGPETFGLRREPDAVTIKRVLLEVEREASRDPL